MDKYTRKGTITYSSKNTKVSPISFYAVLINGNKHQFSQGMTFQGGSLNISGSTRSLFSNETTTKQYPVPSIIINE